MFKSYLAVGFRNVMKHKAHSSIAIVGLAIGLTCAILVFLFVREELRYDQFHEGVDRIYRVVREVHAADGSRTYDPTTSGPMAAALQRDCPEVARAVHSWSWAVWIQHGDQWFHEHLELVDTDFLTVLDFPLLRGDRETALQKPYSIVLTEHMAQRYFGDEDPIGRTLRIDREDLSRDYTVTGVVRLPRTSSFAFDFLISTVPPSVQTIMTAWQTRTFFQTFVKVKPNASASALAAKLPAFIAKYRDDAWQKRNFYHLQPLTRIHLYSNADYPGMEPWRGDNITYLYLVSLTGAFILLIACVNFVNLTTARSVVRAREVGIRKVAGAHRYQLIGQFMGESLVVTALALVLALGLAEVLLPTFNDLTGKQLTLLSGGDGLLIPGIVGIAVGVGLLSGLYPAFALSGFHPLAVLKGGTGPPLKGRAFRNGLVVFQFSLSVLLVIATAVVYRQLDFVQHQDQGFDPDHVVIVPVFQADRSLDKAPADRLSLRYEQVKQAFMAYPGVLAATASRIREPADGGRSQPVRAAGMGGDLEMRVQEVDEDFLSVYDMSLIAGRSLSPEAPDGVVLNETAVRRLGWTEAVGKAITVGGRARTVIGVVKDYHSGSFYEAMAPVVLTMPQGDYASLSLKIRTADVPGTLAFLARTWAQWVPRRPFRYYFVDSFMNRAYQDDQRFGEVVSLASVVAIFVACLGLLGLSSFMVVQRTKEIGIRKVLGATSSHLSVMLSRDFLKPVVLANFIACPVAYWAMGYWLDHFAYRTTLSLWLFAWSVLLVVGVAMATVSVQAIRAARANPVDALRYE